MKLSALIIFSIFFSINVFSQNINPDEKPAPFKSTSFEFPKYTVKTLSNGLKIFIIEDKEQPTIAFRLMIYGGSSVDGSKSGIAELTAGMLTKGTKNKSAVQIANSMDGIGANLTSSANSDYITVFADGLKKYQNTIFETLSDIIINPTFPEDEFLKLQQQTIAGIQYEKSNPGTLAQALARIAVYGKDHPYSSRNTELSISSIATADLINYHKKWFSPKNASLAVVGDINPDEVVKEIEKHLKKWQKFDTPKIEIPEPQMQPKGIYFIQRKGSVQTYVTVSAKTIPYNHYEYDKLNLATQIIGGANGRLYRTLREKHSFTYSPYGYLTSTKYINRFAAVAEVAAEKTDSSIAVIQNEINDLIKSSPSKDELERVRLSYLGNYYMSFENSLFVASLIQNEDFYGNNIHELEKYPKKIESIIPEDITTVVMRYYNSDNMQIVVAGDPQVLPSIEKYGKIYQYNLDLEPLTGADAKLEKISLSPDQLIEKYENAIGGKNNISKITTVNAVSTAELVMNGQVVKGEILSQKKAPNKLYNMSNFGLFASQTWVDGENAWAGSLNQPAVAQDGASKERMLFEAEMFNVLALRKHGYKLDVKGKQGDKILLTAEKNDNQTVYYFNANTFLLEETELNLDGLNGVKEIWTIVAADYAPFEGVMLPTLQKTIAPTFTITLKTNYTVNKEIDDAVFKPQM